MFVFLQDSDVSTLKSCHLMIGDGYSRCNAREISKEKELNSTSVVCKIEMVRDDRCYLTG